MAIFTKDEIREIQKRAMDALIHEAPREFLFQGVDRDYIDSLPRYGNNDRDQIQSDLLRMNTAGWLGEDQFPLAYWLDNVSYRLSGRSNDQKFFRRMADLAAERRQAEIAPPPPPPLVLQPPPVAAQTSTREILPDTVQERILFKSDLLPVGFLRGAMATADAVCRIELRRIENGAPQTYGDGKPYLMAGTGWLIGRRHVMTNYHVVRGRIPGEAEPSSSDLAAQAADAKIAFNIDSETVLPSPIKVAGLVAHDAELDFAIIELAEDAPSPPLPLLDKPLALDEEHRFAVNIIQHPGGASKQLAIRNNLAVAIDGANLAYFTDTDKGSSGSPVCDDDWRVVALHKAATRTMGEFNYQGKATAWVNIGTPIVRIIDHLRKDVDGPLGALWKKIDPVLVKA
jgi:V8-like Glu-specific endopeptidase